MHPLGSISSQLPIGLQMGIFLVWLLRDEAAMGLCIPRVREIHKSSILKDVHPKDHTLHP